MFLSTEYSYAADCEILDVEMYETEQSVIATDWYWGIAYRKYQTEVYPCVHIRLRSNYQLSISTEDLEITATFTDKSRAVKKFGCKEKRLEYGEEYLCGICFESKFPIDSLECTVK